MAGLDADSFNKILDGLSKIAWPLIAVVLMLLFTSTFRQAFSTRPFKIKVGDMEIDVQQATDQITKQIQDLQSNVAELKPAEVAGLEADTKPLAKNVPKAAPTEAASTGLRILWVDDRPENNAFEIATLRGEGAEITQVRSTKEALELISQNPQKYDIIISDMGRREGLSFLGTAGLELLRALRARDIQTPFYFYSTSQALKGHIDEITSAGASGATTSPVELVRQLRHHAQTLG
jgi:CheY-like chemotaxis protein